MALFKVDGWASTGSKEAQLQELKSFFDTQGSCFVSDLSRQPFYGPETYGRIYPLSRIGTQSTDPGDARFGVPVNWTGNSDGNFDGSVASNAERPFSLYVQDWWSTDDKNNKVKRVIDAMQRQEQVVINYARRIN